MTKSKFWKYKDIKTYASTEWLAYNTKRYRSVFDEQEAAYVYCELSFYNKKFDEANWNINLNLKCYSDSGDEVCDLNCDRTIDKQENLIFVREGWGVKNPGTYWKSGHYKWEAWVEGELVATVPFFIEGQGMIRNGLNPYFKLESVKLYEGPDANLKLEERKYYIGFNALSTRYIWVEMNMKNLVRKSSDWACELLFNFKTENGYQKGSITKLIFVRPDEDFFNTTIGWGSDMVGTWGRGFYRVEVVFMDELVASMPFEVGDDYLEAEEEDFLPMIQLEFFPDAEDTMKVQEEKEAEKQDVNQELEGLIGLEAIKEKIAEYTKYLEFIQLRKKKGLADVETINLHAVFKGNPGTGKTTVARLLGKIYKDLGLLKKGHVHEVDRADLVAEFIGQTAPKTKEAIKKAKDGILFIDEAYSLARKDDDSKDFGKEAIEVILKEMSDSDDFAVIAAGYPEEMDNFIKSNPGLKSRFNMTYDFPDYVPQELRDIADYSASKKGVKLDKEAKELLYKKLVDSYRDRDRFFGNARMVNSLIDESKMNLGLRIMKETKPDRLSNEVLSTITKEDVQASFENRLGKKADIPIDEELLKDSLNKLKGLIGLQSVKNDIEDLVKLVRYYKDTGKDVRETFSLHTVFTGNPGTGKTTVARILAQIYKALGILERGHLVECDRQSLVGAYVGQTAIKTAEIVEKSMGGVLFIDEAYSLTEGAGSDYGREAVETLLKRMEDERGKFIVIAAGYTANMEKFMESNPGLKSRFDRVFLFEDFKPAELLEIAVNQLDESNMSADKEASEHLKKYIAFMYEKKDKYFGNGRAVRRVIEEAVRNQHLRLSEVAKSKRTKKMIQTLTIEDVDEFDSKNQPKPTKGIGFK